MHSHPFSTEKIPTRELVFFNPSGSSLAIQVIYLDLIEQENTCRLTFQVNSQLYQQIETELLFNLKRELRGVLNAVSFESDADIEIEATLQPQLLPQLAEHATDSKAAIAYLIACSQNSYLQQKAKKKLKTDATDKSLVFSEVTDALENLVEQDRLIGKAKANVKGKIYQAILNFFSEEDWEFTKLQGELILRLACLGKNGRWNCFAQANETQQRYFYLGFKMASVLLSANLLQ